MRVGEVEDVDDVARREAELFVLDGVVVPQGDGHGALLGRFDVHRLRLHRIGQIVCKSYANQPLVGTARRPTGNEINLGLVSASGPTNGVGSRRGGGRGCVCKSYANPSSRLPSLPLDWSLAIVDSPSYANRLPLCVQSTDASNVYR